MKTKESLEIRICIKGHVTLNISCSQTNNKLCPIHRTSEVSKTLDLRWHKKFQDGFINDKYGSRSGQPKTIVFNANIAAEADQIKQENRLTLQNSAYSVGILSGSAHKIFTQQLKLRKVCIRWALII